MAKKDRKDSGGFFWKFLFVLALCVFGFSVYQLVTIYKGYKEGVDEYRSVAHEVVKESEDPLVLKDQKTTDEGVLLIAEEPEFNPPDVDFEKLRQMNPDVIGWIEVEALPDISYPIVQAKNNDYYLHRTFKKKDNYAGSIFADCVNAADFSDCNTIIYGHNMKNGSMFGNLNQLCENEKYKKSRYLWICTTEGKRRYEIFSMQYADVDSETYTLYDKHDDAFGNYLNIMERKSEINMRAKNLDKDDSIVTLSTCTSNDRVRFVVQARWVGTY